MKHLCFFFIILLLISCSSTKKAGLSAHTYKSQDGNPLLYNIYYPDEYHAKGAKLPLFIWLHGAGERGDDNVAQLIHIAPYLASDLVQKKYPSIILVPQCPENDYWAPIKRTEWTIINEGEVTAPMSKLIALIQQIMHDPKVDKSRIYIGGLSMGGFGTLDLISRKPEWFAAATPICGGADLTKVANFKAIPLWIFHGAKDPVVPVSLSHDLVKALEKHGVRPKYTEYPEGGHDEWNQAVKEQDYLSWLFQQRK